MKKQKKILNAFGIGITFVLLFWGSVFSKKEEFPYAEKIINAENLMKEENLEEALEALNEIEKEFGKTDRVHKNRALIYLYEKNFKKAIAQAERLSDKTSKEYFSLKAYIYEYMGEAGKEYLFDTYIEAADAWPDWTYMQKYAGVAQMERYNYGAAEAYLHQAYRQGGDDPILLFEIGALKFYQGDYEASVHFFQEAVDHELPIEMYEHVAYFLYQIKGDETE